MSWNSALEVNSHWKSCSVSNAWCEQDSYLLRGGFEQFCEGLHHFFELLLRLCRRHSWCEITMPAPGLLQLPPGLLQPPPGLLPTRFIPVHVRLSDEQVDDNIWKWLSPMDWFGVVWLIDCVMSPIFGWWRCFDDLESSWSTWSGDWLWARSQWSFTKEVSPTPPSLCQRQTHPRDHQAPKGLDGHESTFQSDQPHVSDKSSFHELNDALRSERTKGSVIYVHIVCDSYLKVNHQSRRELKNCPNTGFWQGWGVGDASHATIICRSRPILP